MLFQKNIKKPITILVKENSRAKELLIDDKHINEIINLDRTKTNTGSHDGILGIFKFVKDFKKKNLIKFSYLVVL